MSISAIINNFISHIVPHIVQDLHISRKNNLQHNFFCFYSFHKIQIVIGKILEHLHKQPHLSLSHEVPLIVLKLISVTPGKIVFNMNFYFRIPLYNQFHDETIFGFWSRPYSARLPLPVTIL